MSRQNGLKFKKIASVHQTKHYRIYVLDVGIPRKLTIYNIYDQLSCLTFMLAGVLRGLCTLQAESGCFTPGFPLYTELSEGYRCCAYTLCHDTTLQRAPPRVNPVNSPTTKLIGRRTPTPHALGVG